VLRKFGKFPESLVGIYIAQVLQGLVYLHSQGVIHRDIKATALYHTSTNPIFFKKKMLIEPVIVRAPGVLLSNRRPIF